MPPLYITTQGAKLRYRKRRLVVEKQGRGKGERKEIAAVPAVHVSQVLIFGNVSVTTPAIGFLLANEIDVTFLTLRGRYKGRLVGPSGGNSRLRLRQYERAIDPAWALETARAIVTGKLHNTRTLLRRYARRLTPSPPQEEGRGGDLTAAADQITDLISSADRCRAINSLNGVEGRGAAVYFGVLRRLIQSDDEAWAFTKRNRRPPRDPVNVLLSFGYTVLTHNVESAVRAVGLDAYIGFLHQIAYNRPSLALDLVEEFRCIIVDSVVLRCINNNIILPKHFAITPGGTYPVLLSDEGRSRFIRELEMRFNLEFKHPDSKERVTYRRCFELQARQLARCLQTGDVYRPFKVR
ncbi:MAG: CRISPR-associated endonuclease Cas1 [Chloroflexi bacterium]|nr:MAG: CRISPR-associated endonuclease Cas1 [Chloroflexota bacterium]RLC84258.1 MAG: CRISPR-associated endonuclease Cas1 [Chloroflexota bacterium]